MYKANNRITDVEIKIQTKQSKELHPELYFCTVLNNFSSYDSFYSYAQKKAEALFNEKKPVLEFELMNDDTMSVFNFVGNGQIDVSRWHLIYLTEHERRMLITYWAVSGFSPEQSVNSIENELKDAREVYFGYFESPAAFVHAWLKRHNPELLNSVLVRKAMDFEKAAKYLTAGLEHPHFEGHYLDVREQ